MKNFLMKQMLKRQMKGVSESDQKKMMDIIEKDPEFFVELAKEIQEEMKNGGDQMTASIKVLSRHQEKLEKLKNS